ncbi:MAG: alpha-ketoglutarate-dependent dioxygenase AlkB [Pseudomonadota bacterium]
MDLFASSTQLNTLPLEEGALGFLDQLALPWPNAQVLRELIDGTDWRAEHITVYGKQYLQPRLTAWHGEARYAYSGLSLDPLPWTPLLAAIRDAVQAVTACRFNSVLLNYYRDGQDSMGMHSDDEAELGPEPAIASLSFGATRTFILKHKRRKLRHTIVLTDGSLLLMHGPTQHNWLHGIHKESRPCGARVNLTFRYIA